MKKLSLAEAIRLDSFKRRGGLSKNIWMLSSLKNCRRWKRWTEQQDEKKSSKLSKSMLGSELQGEVFMNENGGSWGTWKITQLKKLSFEEVKEEFDKLDEEEKDDEAKDDESTKKSGKRRKQMARKGMNTNVGENDSEDSVKVGEHEESNTGTETPINPVPVAMKLLVIVMNRYGVDGPEDKLEKGFWKCLRIMFEEPLSTDS
ncbi:hypothetical protein Tco_0971945 [Tanacetum coccineum]